MINLSGKWTERQVVAIERTCADELKARGLELFTIEVTTHNDRVRWFLLRLFCVVCDGRIPPGMENTSPRACLCMVPLIRNWGVIRCVS